MILRPLTRWWVGQLIYGGNVVARVEEILDDEVLKLWILNGQYRAWYDHQLLKLGFYKSGLRPHQLKKPFQEIVETEAGQYWPAVDGQIPPWEE